MSKSAKPAKNRGGTDTLTRRGLVQLNALCTEAERRRIQAAAALDGEPVNSWLRTVALARADALKVPAKE